MPWLDNIFHRIKAPFTPDPAVLDTHAVNLFDQAARAPGHDVQEQAWISSFLSRMHAVQERKAERTWLHAVENHDFLLLATDRRIESLKTALVVDISGPVGKPVVLNVRTLWVQFVRQTVVNHAWDISLWPQRERWLNAILTYAWDAENPHQDKYQAYLEKLATWHIWARDAALEYRALHARGSETLEAMFAGPSNMSVPFITALVTVALRMHQKAPTVAMSRLHRRACTAWPVEMAQIEATMQAYAMMEGTSVAEVASLAKSMEVGEKGYSAYFPFYAKSIHAIVHEHLGQPLDVLELPLLD